MRAILCFILELRFKCSSIFTLCIQQSENKNFFFPLDRICSLSLTHVHCHRKGVKCIFIWLFLARFIHKKEIYCRESFKLIEFKLFSPFFVASKRRHITEMTSTTVNMHTPPWSAAMSDLILSKICD